MSNPNLRSFKILVTFYSDIFVIVSLLLKFDVTTDMFFWKSNMQVYAHETKLQVYYPSPDTALNAVRSGEAWGVLYFTENFTDALVARMALGKDSDEETLDQSEIRVWLDMSSEYLVRVLNVTVF